MSAITTHVLDTASGEPASGIAVTLEYQTASGAWEALAQGRTNSDGRIGDMAPPGAALQPGLYSLRFNTSTRSQFFPEVVVRFRIENASAHYHVPLLLGPFGYTVYRGS